MSTVQVREAAQELGYQPDAAFCLKVSQLREIFAVRWSVFLLGPAGCGKTAIWKTLMRAQQLAGEKTVYKPINPKVRLLLKDQFRISLSIWFGEVGVVPPLNPKCRCQHDVDLIIS